MTTLLLLIILALLTWVGFFYGRNRSLAVVSGTSERLHSRPHQYGLYVALWCALPAILVGSAWLIVQPVFFEQLLLSSLPEEFQRLSPQQGPSHFHLRLQLRTGTWYSPTSNRGYRKTVP